MLLNKKDEICYRGCNLAPKIIAPSQELVDLYELLKSYENLRNDYKRVTFRNEIKAGRNFLQEMYDINDVPWSFYRKLLLWDIDINGDISPFKLPIKKIKGESENFGLLVEDLILGDNLRILYKRIEVSETVTEMLPLTYVHEITHTQQNHVSGLIEDYYNTEVLSIFNELLYAYFKSDRLSRLYDISRIQDVIESIKLLFNFRDKHDEEYDLLVEACCYNVSTLKAYNLFSIYYYGNESIKKQVIMMIQKVFDHEITVEECLKTLDVSYENSLNVQKLERLLRR